MTHRGKQLVALAIMTAVAMAPSAVSARPTVDPVVASGRVCALVEGDVGDVALVNVTPVGAQGAGNGLLVSSDVDVVLAAGVSSSVNFGVGSVDPNVASAVIGADGRVCFVNSRHAGVHVVLDHLGTVDGSVFTAASASGAAVRVLDTRGVDGAGDRLVASGRVCALVEGDVGDVALVNVTPVGAQGAGNGLLVSSDVDVVLAAGVSSSVNFGVGSVDPNVASAVIGADGRVCFVNSRHAGVHVVLDHLGTVDGSVFTAASASGAAVRVLDTRGVDGAGDRLVASGRVCALVEGDVGDVALVNVTPVGAQGAGNGLLVSSDVDVVLAAGVSSSVNFGVGSVDPNVASAVIGADGRVCFVNSRHAGVHVVLDHLGTVDGSVFTAASASGAAVRVLDTRPVTDLDVIGDDACRSDSELALRKLSAEAPSSLAIVVEYVDVIECVGAGSGMYAWEELPRFAVGDSSRNAGSEWYASVMVHDAVHSLLYHQYEAEHPGVRVPDLIWTGRQAEAICLTAQAEALEDMGASQSTIDYVNNVLDTNYFDIPVDQRYW